MTELWQHSAVELAAGIRDGEYTAVEVLDSVLARVDAHTTTHTTLSPVLTHHMVGHTPTG